MRSALFGVAVGDALGVPVEFRSRGYLVRNPVKDMIGCGSHNQSPADWQDCFTELKASLKNGSVRLPGGKILKILQTGWPAFPNNYLPGNPGLAAEKLIVIKITVPERALLFLYFCAKLEKCFCHSEQ